MNRVIVLSLAAALAAALLAGGARADLTIGGMFSATGPNAAIGLPGKNASELMPRTIAGQPVKYVILDDAVDPSLAVKHMRQLVQENKVDAIIGSSSTPTCLAMSDIALEAKTLFMCLAPIPIRNQWAFSVPQATTIMVEGIVDHMKANGVKSVAFIGFADGWGDQNYDAIMKLAPPAGIKVLGNERYARTDTSVTAQILKMLAMNPDAVFIGASSVPATLPSQALVDRGYKGKVYHTHGVIGPDFLRVGGKALEGMLAPSGPFPVAEQLPDSSPIKKTALDFKAVYQAKFGPVSPFAGYSYDAYLWLNAAIPVALKKAKPGTVEFREALRDAVESLKDVTGTQAVYSLSPSNHNGVDRRGRVMVRVESGSFKLIP
jgi:branched-chain amino acid transport system substrate-binding protein